MATQDEKIRFIFETKDKSTKKLQAISLAVIGINQAMEIGRKVAEKLKKAWDFTKEGAQLLRTEEKFDRLAQTIGTTGDVLADDLQEALGGVLSRTEALALGTDLLSLGLVDSREEAARMAAVVGQLGMDMNQLVLTLTNRTTMRFDALGVAVEGFDDKVKELRESGLDVQDAFTEAFLEQAEEQVEKVGDVADTTAGQIMILENAWKDFKDSIKAGVAEGVAPAIQHVNELREAQDQYQRVVELGLLTDEQYIANQKARAEGTFDVTVAVKEFIPALEAAEAAMERTAEVAGKTDLASKLGIDEVNEGLKMAESNMKDFARASVNAAVQAQIWNAAVSDGIITEEEEQQFRDASQALGVEIPEDFKFMVDTFNTYGDDAVNTLDEINDYLMSLTGRRWTIRVSTGGGLPAGVSRDARPGGVGHSTGANFVVPPGFPNDSYPMRVESGEHVKVTPKGQSGNADVVAAINDLKDEMYRINRELVAAHS